MKIEIERVPYTDTYRLWASYSGPGEGRVCLVARGLENGRLVVERVPVREGALSPGPFLELDPVTLAAIARAASDVLPPDAAVDRHLKDAIATRDRLLALVEKHVSSN